MISFFSEKKNEKGTTRGVSRSFIVTVRRVLTRFRVGPTTTPAVRAVKPLAVQFGTVPAVRPFTSSIVRHATPPTVRVVALPAVQGVTPAAFSGMASLALVQPSLALRGWTTALGQKTVDLMTVGSATVGPRTIVSAIGGRTDDGMFTSMGALCDKSVTFFQFPRTGLHSRRRSRDLSMVPVEIVDRDPPLNCSPPTRRMDGVRFFLKYNLWQRLKRESRGGSVARPGSSGALSEPAPQGRELATLSRLHKRLLSYGQGHA